MNFKVRDQKNVINSDAKGGDERVVNLQFYSLAEEMEKTQGLLDLKHGGSQSKNIGDSQARANWLPIVKKKDSQIYSNRPRRWKQTSPTFPSYSLTPIQTQISPILQVFPSIILGWSDCDLSNLSEMSIANFQDLSKKWIHSAAEKVDLWSVAIKLGEVINA